MSRVTKEIAGMVARSLLKDKLDACSSARDEFRYFIKKMYVDTIPVEVSETQKLHPDYFSKTNSIAIDGNGLPFEVVKIEGEYVINNSGNYYCLLEMDEKNSDIAVNLKRKYEKLHANYHKLLSETKEALIALRTYNKVEELLPEAFPYLPVKQKMELQVDLSGLRKKLSTK